MQTAHLWYSDIDDFAATGAESIQTPKAMIAVIIPALDRERRPTPFDSMIFIIGLKGSRMTARVPRQPIRDGRNASDARGSYR